MSSTPSLRNASASSGHTEYPTGIPIFSWRGSNLVLVFIFSGVKLREDISFELDKVAQFMYEPKLLQVDHSTSAAAGDNDYYRKKTIDKFAELDEAFMELNVELQRPMGKDVHLHLLDVKSHSSGCLKSIRTSHLHSVSEIYEHARYEAEPFGENEYKKFEELSTEIVTVLRQRTRKKIKKSQPPTEEEVGGKVLLSVSDAEADAQRHSAAMKSQPTSDISPLLLPN